MRKFLDVLAIILFFIWMIGLILLHIGVIGVIKDNFPENLIYGILVIAAWWGILLAVFKISDLRDRKKEKLYKEKYVTEVSIEDAFFGKMTFEDDSNKSRMRSAELHFPKFGADVLDTLYIEGYTEADREKIFRAFQGVYEHQDEILDALSPELLDIAEEYEEVDENGEPYTLEKIRERAYISWTRVFNDDEGVVVVMEVGLTEGEIELGGHGFDVVINCADKTMDFNMEG